MTESGEHPIAGSDEHRHRPSGEPNWYEAWLLDFVQTDASTAASFELVLWPNRKRASFITSVVRPGRPLISLVELDAAAPRPPGLELRAPALWTELGIQTELEHVTVDLEAFAVELDDPDDVFAGAFGVRIALGCELEWESAAPARRGPQPQAYSLPCVVHGQLLIGSDVLEIDGFGWRSHRWGLPALDSRHRVTGHSHDGSWDVDPEALDHELGVAPVPDPARSPTARLTQRVMTNELGDRAWVRDELP